MDEIENIENIVIIAIIVLLIVFVGSLVALIVICYQRRTYLKNGFRKHFTDHNHLDDTFLIANGTTIKKNGQRGSNMELDDVRLHPNIDQILSDAQWVDDATGLIPHCLALLKGCHHLTERLVAATMSAMPRFTETDQRMKLFEIGRVAPTISPRVDDVVEAMYPPLDPRLLESRCLSLLLSVSRFAIVITYTCAIRGQWIDDELQGLELQLKMLREVGQTLLLINGDENGNLKSQPSIRIPERSSNTTNSDPTICEQMIPNSN